MFRLALLCLFGLTYNQVSAEQSTEAIVGGDFAKAGDFKYQVFVHFRHNRCGGVIIADQFILTAAHCVSDSNGHILQDKFTVIAGTVNVNDRHDAIEIHADTVYIHKHFNRQKQLNDIAILKLTHSLQLRKNHHKVEKINLPQPSAHFENVCAVFSGFGDHEIKVRYNHHGQYELYDGKFDGKLRFASVYVINNEKCSEVIKRPIPPTYICGQMLQRKHPQGVCRSDSGGPLVYAGKVIGIQSFGPINCNEKNYPGVYTRVSSYLNFINSIIHGKPGDDVHFASVPH